MRFRNDRFFSVGRLVVIQRSLDSLRTPLRRVWPESSCPRFPNRGTESSSSVRKPSTLRRLACYGKLFSRHRNRWRSESCGSIDHRRVFLTSTFVQVWSSVPASHNLDAPTRPRVFALRSRQLPVRRSSTRYWRARRSSLAGEQRNGRDSAGIVYFARGGLAERLLHQS